MEGSNGVSGGGGMLPVVPASMAPGTSLHHHHQTTHPQQQRHLSPFPAAQRHEVVVDHSPQHQHQPLGHAAFGDDGGTASATAAPDGAKRFSQSISPSPWQRMKWTDSMVRLLIMIVYCVGDDAGGAGTDQGEQQQQQHQPAPAASASGKGKKATTMSAATSAAGLLLQKKGKWKSVSRAMMEKGFYVSPQQCEDKFNDLNKRYKRVNELLGRGTACQVVENQALLDSLDHLSPSAKEEARKLLNSKHLFFREMCAYHNSSSSTCALQPQPPHSQPLQLQSQSQSKQQQQQQHCFHHPSDSSITISFPRPGEPSFVGKGSHNGGSMLGGLNEEEDDEKGNKHDDDNNNIEENETGDDDDEGEEEDYDDEEEEEDSDDNNRSKHHRHQQRVVHEDHEKKEPKVTRRTTRTFLPMSSLSASPPLSLSLSSSSPVPMEQLKSNLMGSLASMGGEQQQRQWLKRKAAELEEQRVEYQCRALELERQRFKWLRFSSNKEREMERMKLSNDRLCLENDRMLLLLRQKEQELIGATAAATTSSNHLHHSLLH